MNSIVSPRGENNERIRGWGMFLNSHHFGVKGRAGAQKWGLGRITSSQLFTQTYTNQTTSWLVCNWSIFGARTSHGQTDSQDSPGLRLGGRHHLPLLSIIYA
jgi:hypothetical protein